MKKIYLLLSILFLMINGKLFSQNFSTVATVFSSEVVTYSEFGDYDNDGDLDILLLSDAIKIFRNDNGVFANSGLNLPISDILVAKLGDFDRDGDLDLATVGGKIMIYKNTNNLFTLYYISDFVNFFNKADASWGDADNDGDLDFIATGSTNSTPKNFLLKNIDTTFNIIPTCFETYSFSSVSWGDFDNDGDQDLLFTTSSKPVIYINNSFTFSLLPNTFSTLPYVQYNTILLNSSIWADYDLDGDLDLVTMGRELNTPYNEYSAIYENQNGMYNVSPVTFLNNMQGQMIKVVDVENDGDLDFVSFSTSYPWMEANNNGLYSINYLTRDGSSLFKGLSSGNSSMADYDNDGYLDILHTGRTILNSVYVTYLLSGNSGAISYTINTIPTIPTNIVASAQGNDVQFSWDKSTDAQTPQAALTYNLRIGTSSGGNEILSAMSAADGNLLIAQAGNCSLLNSRTIKGILPGTYYWSVQCVDNGLIASAFAPEDTLVVLEAPIIANPTNNSINLIPDVSFSWFRTTNASSYQIQLSTSPDFSSQLIDSTVIDTALFLHLDVAKTYYWRVRAKRENCISNWSTQWFFKTVPMETVYLSNPIICKTSTVNLTVNLTLNSSINLLDSLNTAGTKYIIELLNHNQNTTIILDTVSITGQDTLAVTLPDTISIGNYYRFRIRCMDSNFVCIENNTDIQVENNVIFYITQDSVINSCWSTPPILNISLDPHVQYFWYIDGVRTIYIDSTIIASQTGTYSVVADSLICPSISNTVNVILNKPVIILSPSNIFQLCNGDSVLVSVNFDDSYSYSWSNGDTVPATTLNNFGMYYILVTDTNQCTNYDSVTVAVMAGCNVWPGDANNDSLVNNFDLLPIGLYYSEIGIPRTTISNNWEPYLSSNWGTTQTNGSNKKHVDCNGDGLIDINDTLAINLNFSSTHIFMTNPNNDKVNNPDFYFFTANNSYNAGDWVNAELWLGNATNPVSDLYGIAFNINYDVSLVQSGTESISYTNSWIGTPSTNAITISKIDEVASIAYGSITRINHLNTSGFGKIAEFRFQTKSAIVSSSNFHLSISNYQAIDATGELLTFNTLVDSITFYPAGSSITEVNIFDEINISPNPFTEQTMITISKNINQQLTTIKIFNVLGKEIKSLIINGEQGIIEKGEMRTGIYFLQIYYENKNVGTRKIIVQ